MSGGTLHLDVTPSGSGHALPHQQMYPRGIQVGYQTYVELTSGAAPGDSLTIPPEPPEVVPPTEPEDPGPIWGASGTAWIRRIERTVPSPTLDANGKPVDWDQGVPTYSLWGRFRIVIGGHDVTFFRGVPTRLISYSKAEPFGDKAAVILFPQITPFEAYPSWMKEGANVDLYKISPGPDKRLWEGFIPALTDGLSETIEGLRLECLGAMYQYDLLLKHPEVQLDYTPVDTGVQLAEQLSPTGDKRSVRCRPLPAHTTGIKVQRQGAWQDLLTGWAAGLLAQSQLPGEQQWTIKKYLRRQPKLIQKDLSTHHYSVHVGEQGVEHELKLDLSQAPTTIYGEGDYNNCHWRNAKYPYLHADTAPVFSGTLMYAGNSYSDMALFGQHLHDHGWPGFNGDEFYSSYEESLVRAFQAEAQIQVDGIIGPQTWASAFDVGANIGSFKDAFIAPVFSLTQVEYYKRNSAGAVLGLNSSFDPNVIRRERYENFGAEVSKDQARQSGQQEVARDWPPSYMGSLTLKTDPPELSRYEIEEGNNIILRGHHGTDRLLHIAEYEIQVEEGIATLQVDEKARDWMTLGAMLRRDKDTNDPARRPERHYQGRKGSVVQDKGPLWDCESGAGIIPYHAIYAGLWDVRRIPAGRAGTIVRTEIVTKYPCLAAIGVFDRPVTAAMLARLGDGNPLHYLDYWDSFPDPADPHDPRRVANNIDGLIIGWGASADLGGEPGGFWPYKFSDNKPMTGKSVDSSTWYFEAVTPPWLYVAIFVDTEFGAPTINYVSGHLEPDAVESS